PTDGPSLRVFKWALKHRLISAWPGVEVNLRGRFELVAIRTIASRLTPLDHQRRVSKSNFLKLILTNLLLLVSLTRSITPTLMNRNSGAVCLDVINHFRVAEAQTNLQGEVQPTDGPSLRVFKWALKHRLISAWPGVEVNLRGRFELVAIRTIASRLTPLDHQRRGSKSNFLKLILTNLLLLVSLTRSITPTLMNRNSGAVCLDVINHFRVV
uniref:Uncharacterized protein n=1 Tax=Brassica oleracea var. oleracea TaxID=109376 RepID=A0A0D3C5Y1_BRAOL